jgi:hypothetical protein
MEEGLMLEREQNLLLHFIKIHAPVEVIGRYAEILKLRMPMKKVSRSFIILYDVLLIRFLI